MILESFAAGQPVHSLLQLLRIGRLWYRAIVNSPRLWTRLDATLPPKIARLVVERSKDLPNLSFEWSTDSRYDIRDGLHPETFEVVLQNSTRFKSMTVQLPFSIQLDIRPLLEVHTQALERLTVEVGKRDIAGDDGFGEFVLSDGAPLEYLHLHGVSLNFDSPRLSGLITLHLYRSAVPSSLDILLEVLSATWRLEELKICEQGYTITPVDPGPRTTLWHLKELEIEDITNEYCAALLSSIYTPICFHVRVRDSWLTLSDRADPDPFDSLIWQPGNAQMIALLGLSQQSDTRISITVEESGVHIDVHEEDDDGPRSLSLLRPEPWEILNLLGDFFNSVPSCPPIDLTISSVQAYNDPFDLGPWGDLLESLDLSRSMSSVRAMEQLAQRTSTHDTSETTTNVTPGEDWMCPNLQCISFFIPEVESERDLHVAALLSLVEKRWLEVDGGPAPASQPTDFEVISNIRTYEWLQDVEIAVKKVVPSCVFRRPG